MTSAYRVLGPGALVVLAGCCWGLYWLPVRALEAAGWGGALGSLIVVVTALVILLPFVWRFRHAGERADRLGLLATATGGASFMLYSVGLVEGRIASVILLFYLTPVWTTLITRFVLRWPIPGLRYLVIALGLVGLVLVLGADGGWPLPRNSGEWLGLFAGGLWSVATIGMRLRGDPAPLVGTALFLVGATAAGVLLWLVMPAAESAITIDWPTAGWILAAAVFWWIGSMLTLVWAAARLDPARVGILLMSEVLVGVFSAALWAGEGLGPIQYIGAALLVLAGVLDAISG